MSDIPRGGAKKATFYTLILQGARALKCSQIAQTA